MKWYKILVNGSNSCVINNGHFSKFFDLERGCRQGDPLSPYIFILSIEPLAQYILKCSNVKGIQVNTYEHKVGQYADDTFCLLDGSNKSLNTVLSIFKKFEQLSGLKINVDKTQIVWLGSKTGSEERMGHQGLKWVEKFTLLGITFSVRLCEIDDLNYKDKLMDVEKVLLRFGKRHITLLGRITVLKTLAIPKLVHALTVLPPPSTEILTRLKQLITCYLWQNGKAKVSAWQLAQKIENGGLKMTHLETYIQTLRLSWIKRLTSARDGWQNLFYTNLNIESNEHIWELDRISLTKLEKQISNPFWKSVIMSWKKIVEIKSEDDSTEILKTPLFGIHSF